MLKSLELSGFKSFAKKTSLEFKSRITAIVGPNGSGKSNVAEAFRFVLGEQSIKSMRGKRGEDLIWNGSTDVGRSNIANVKLVFDNSKKVFSLDFDELSIERAVARDGNNEYKLNQSNVRLKDVVEKLAEAHIGASGHHIISQGEADRILTASTKERKNILEDALGLRIYHYKKEESKRKLEKTLGNMREVELLRKEIAPHLKFLKKQVERAERAEESRSRLTEAYKEYLKRENIYIKYATSQIEKEIEPIKKILDDLEQSMEKARERLAASSQKDSKSDKLLSIERSMNDLHHKRDAAVRDIGKIEGEEAASIRILELEQEEKTEPTESVPLAKVKELGEYAEKEVWRAQNFNTIEELRLILINLSEKIKSLLTEHSKSTSGEKNNVIRSRLEKLSQIKNDLQNKKSEIEKGIEELNTEYKNLRLEIDKEKDVGREAEREIFRIGAEQNTSRNKLENLESKKHDLKKNDQDLKEELRLAASLLGSSAIGIEGYNLGESEEETALENRQKQIERKLEIERMKIRLEELGGNSGVEVLKEYRETEERDRYLENELLDITKSAKTLEEIIIDLNNRLDTEFRTGIEKINKSFREFFTLMFDGGEAKLEVVKSEKKRSKQNPEETDSAEIEEEPESEKEDGIEISVNLPRKRIKSLEMLSGGERALTSIALIFAMSQVNPPPFIILDETDAALDEANSKRYGDMIEELSKYSQLILITHNRETMSRAGVIYGVTMGHDGVSRLLSIAFDEAVAVAK